MAKKKPSVPDGTIALNKKAKHEYFLEESFEAGVVLEGWEVKSLRMGKADLADSYVLMKDGEAFLLGAHIIPLDTASTHFVTDPTRTRKLLLHKRELSKLIGLKEREGYTLVATAMYWKACWVKLEFYLGKGKKDHDKRADIKDREWQVDKGRLMKNKNLEK